MKWIYAATLGGLLLAAPALAQRDPPGGASSPPATAPASGQQQFKQISGEYEAAMQSFSNEYRTLKTDEEREKLYNAKYPKPSEYAKRLLPLSQADPKGPLARDVYIWIASHDQNQVGNDALGQLAENFATDPAVAQQIVPRLQWADSPQAEKLLRAVMDKSTDRQSKGIAQLTLGTYLKNHDRTADAEKLLDDVSKNYGDIKLGRETLGAQADNVLFEVRNLAIGKTAPEITGQSIDGKPMKLSDFKGKVVVLDFFGDW